VGLDELVIDTLPVNQPYDGLVAEAYDVWLPHDADDPDVDTYRRFIERNPGPALELGCGTGRLLVRYAALGLDVEGIDASADMLAICAAHARAAGVAPALHHGDWLALDLPREYATLYNPAGSFALIADDEDARTALDVWRRHLRPGGRLLISMGEPRADLDANYEWHVRRSATRASDGVTFTVDEAFRFDTDAQLQHILNRHEVWSPTGELMTTFLRRYRLRWWSRTQFEELLRACGYVDVRSLGTDEAFMVEGRAA
jgi:SAM-dependent methyltransferase